MPSGGRPLLVSGGLAIGILSDDAQYLGAWTGPPRDAGGKHRHAMTVRVFLVDDHEVVRRGLRDLLETEPGLLVVGEAGSAQEALDLFPAAHPDVAVLDVRLPDGDGVELCRELRSRYEGIKALMLTSFDDDEALMSAIMAGASGYVLKQIRGTDLVDAIRQVAAGKSLSNPKMVEHAFGRLRDMTNEGALRREESTPLSAQESRILDLIAEGCTNRQIAARMFLSEKTVKNYVSNLLRKLGMRRRTEAAVHATKMAERRTAEGGPRNHEPGTGATDASLGSAMAGTAGYVRGPGESEGND